MSTVPSPTDPVADDEPLIRSIADDLVHGWEGDRFHLSSASFNDRGMKPSVDRERMRSDLRACLLSEKDGLARILASDVRSIDLAPPKHVPIPVDVTPDPLRCPPHPRENLAHALIAAKVAINPSRFTRLRERLARIAEKHMVVLPASYRRTDPPEAAATS